MIEQQLLQKLAEEINLILRGGQGYGAGQPWSPHKGHPPLGKSEVERYIGAVEEEDEIEQPTKKVKISKAFRNNRR